MREGGQKYLKKDAHHCPHNGRLVAQLIKQKGLTGASLSRLLGVNATVVHRYKKQPTIQTAVLWRIGVALGIDIFALLSVALRNDAPNVVDTTQSGINTDTEKIAALENELRIYKEIVQARMKS